MRGEELRAGSGLALPTLLQASPLPGRRRGRLALALTLTLTLTLTLPLPLPLPLGEWIADDSQLRISILTAPTTFSTLPELQRTCSTLSASSGSAVVPPACIPDARVPAATPLNISADFWSRTPNPNPNP